MEDLHFSVSSIIGALLEGTLAVLMPIAVLIIWKIKTKAKLVPFWIGCLIFPVFALVIESVCVAGIAFADKKMLNLLSNNLLLYTFSAAMAGIFEETGRFVAFKFLLRKYKDRRDSVTYGIGHGGIESIILVGGSAALTLFIALVTNSGLLKQFTTAYNEGLKEAIIDSVEAMASGTFGTYMLAFFERISAVMIHISLSVLVFVSVRQKGKLWLYPLAVFLHFAVDCTVILPHVLGTPLWVFEIVFFLASLAVAVCVAVYYQKLPQVFEAPAPEMQAVPTDTYNTEI